MNKKTIIIAVIIGAVLVVAGGLYYGVNHWRKQQIASQILKEMYGVDANGLLGKLTAGGLSTKEAEEIVKETIKEEEQRKAEVAKEAAKTPEDKYNEAQAVATYDADSKVAVQEVQGIMDKVFGKAKLTAVSTTNYEAENIKSSIMEFQIIRLATGDDLATLTKALTAKGLPIIQSTMAEKTAMVAAGSNETTLYSFGFDVDGQTVGVNIMKTNQ